MNKLLFFFFLLSNFLFLPCNAAQWCMEGGAHPDIPGNLNGLCITSPVIADKIFSGEIAYSNRPSRAQQVEDKVAKLLKHGRGRPSRNGYKAIEFLGKYEGDSGIDGLFKVDYNDEYFYLCIESKYSGNGKFPFGPGININEVYAEQMSTAWIKIIAYNLAKKVKREKPKDYRLDSAYKCFQEIIKNPSTIVIRAVATGDGEGNFNIWSLESYQHASFDNNYLRAMFSA